MRKNVTPWFVCLLFLAVATPVIFDLWKGHDFGPLLVVALFCFFIALYLDGLAGPASMYVVLSLVITAIQGQVSSTLNGPGVSIIFSVFLSSVLAIYWSRVAKRIKDQK